jgi:hypothetical protein
VNTEHTFKLNDVNRSWNDSMGFAHTICSCGKELVAPKDTNELAKKMSEHIYDPVKH